MSLSPLFHQNPHTPARPRTHRRVPTLLSHALSDHLDSLVHDVEQTEETVREVEAIFESTPLMTTGEFDAPSSTRTRIRS